MVKQLSMSLQRVPASAERGRGRLQVVARSGGPPFSRGAPGRGSAPGRGPSMPGGGGLIMPGQNQQGGAPGNARLITPGQKPAAPSTLSRQMGVIGVDESEAKRTGPANPFRPPSGFFTDGKMDEGYLDLEPEQMLQRIQAMGGKWHELFGMLRTLNARGYDSVIIEEMTGLDRRTQSDWIVAGEIYRTLKTANVLTPEEMAYFDHPDRSGCLLEMRYNSIESRPPTARYIVQRGFEADMSTVLARAIKEWERKRDGWESFTADPADCLAFKYWRDALECRKVEDVRRLAEKAYQTASSEKAKAKVKEVLDAPEAALQAASLGVEVSERNAGLPMAMRAEVEFTRLSQTELPARPVAVAGAWGDATADDVLNAGHAAPSGTFGVFSADAGQWVTLPSWRAVAMSRRPVCLLVEDCATIPALLPSRANNDEEKKKIRTGPALILLDRDVSGKAPEGGATWVRAGQGRTLEMYWSGQEGGEGAVAKVVLCVRPAKVEMDVKMDINL